MDSNFNFLGKLVELYKAYPRLREQFRSIFTKQKKLKNLSQRSNIGKIKRLNLSPITLFPLFT